MQRIQVGNGQFISVLFIIPNVIDIHGHRFEIFTLVSEIHENVDLGFGIKNIEECCSYHCRLNLSCSNSPLKNAFHPE